MSKQEKQELIDDLKKAAEDVLGAGDMEKIEGGVLDLKCTSNNVPQCGCTVVQKPADEKIVITKNE